MKLSFAFSIFTAAALFVIPFPGKAVLAFESQIQNPYLEGLMKKLDESALSESELTQLSEYIKEHPKDSDAHLVLANSYRRSGLDGLYADELERAWLLAPDSMIYLITALKIHGSTEDTARIKSLAEESFELYYRDSRRLSTLGTLFRNNNQHELSEKFLSRAIELNPEDKKLRANFCTTLLLRKNYAAVLKNVEPLFSHPETSNFAFLLKGVALSKSNHQREALPLLRTAFASDKRNSEASEAYFDALSATGSYSAALVPGLSALAFQPSFSPHIDDLKKKLTRVFRQLEKEEIKTAADAVAKSTDVEQSLAFYYFALADILDKSGKPRLAIEYYSKGLEIFPFGRAYMRLAHDMEITDTVSTDVYFELYKKAMEMSADDEEVRASYLRAKSRLQATHKDLAGKIKTALGSLRY